MNHSDLQPDERRLNAILSSMAEGLIVTDEDQRVILMNQAAGILLRLAPAEALGQPINAVLPLFKQDEPLAAAELPTVKAITRRNMVVITLLDDIYAQNRANIKFPVSMMVAPLLEPAGVTGVIVILRDITKEKEIDRVKTEFVSLASHQLRTPLSTINWYAEALLDEEIGNINGKQREYLTSLYGASRRLAELVNALLNISRINLGTFSINPEPTDLKALAQSVIEEQKPQIDGQRLKVDFTFDGTLPAVEVDPKLTRIIFQNLLSNAVKYTPAGGQIDFAITKEGEWVRIKVADNGYGIPAADQSRIFTKLFRADNIKEKVPEGTGLGLYLVKAVVEAASGRVTFHSTEGQGTTFYITLPLAGMRSRAGSKELT